MDLFNKYIGFRVKKARKKAKMTQEVLAAAIGKSRPSVCNYEDGKVLIPIPTVYDIAKIFKIHVTEILPEKMPSLSEMEEEMKPQKIKCKCCNGTGWIER